jgi:hypothetical protein
MGLHSDPRCQGRIFALLQKIYSLDLWPAALPEGAVQLRDAGDVDEAVPAGPKTVRSNRTSIRHVSTVEMGNVIRVALTAMALALVIAATACGGVHDESDGPLVARLHVSEPEDSAGFGIGEPITFEFEVQNTRDETLVVTYQRDPPIGWRIEGDTLGEVYESGTYVPRHVGYDELSAGEKLEHGLVWDQKDELFNQQVLPGTYRVQAAFSGGCPPDNCVVFEESSFKILR